MNWYFVEESNGDTFEEKLNAETEQEAYAAGHSRYMHMSEYDRKHSKCGIALFEYNDEGVWTDWLEYYDLSKTVMNEYGVLIDFEAATNLMDDDICGCIVEDDIQLFFNRYCAEHEKEFGEPFELSKPNPVW